ncbi:MAG: universal stress protein [Conexivisphaerales archaeon]
MNEAERYHERENSRLTDASSEGGDYYGIMLNKMQSDEQTKEDSLSLLVGFDGSEQAKRALLVGSDLVRGNSNCTIHIAYVVQPTAGLLEPLTDEFMVSLKKNGMSILSYGESLVKNQGARIVKHLEWGNPSEEMLKLAEKLHPRFVLLGTIKHSPTERVLGTISSIFLRSRRFNLIIVP